MRSTPGLTDRIRALPIAWWAEGGFLVVIAAFTLRLVPRLWRTIEGIPVRIPLDPDEGWNAYHALAATTTGSPYPASASFMTNNYPPLSFYLVGGMGRLLGDNIVAGRIVSLVSCVSVAALIAYVARRFGSNRTEAFFGATLFAGILLLFSDYVGMDDPQLLAHALQMSALVLLVTRRGRLADGVAAALFVCALFVKHNLVALPMAAVIWLLIDDWKRAAGLGGAMLIIGLVALALFRLSFGFDLLSRLNSPRTFSYSLSIANARHWAGPAILPLVATFANLLSGKSGAKFCAIYLLLAAGLGVLFLGGFGVDMNAMFDADIALSIGAALALASLRERMNGYRLLLVPAFALIMVLPLAPVKSLHRFSVDPGTWANANRDDAQTSAEDIAWLKARRGRVMCEMLSLCYWAGKPAEVDVFNLDQQFRTGARPKRPFLRLLDQHAYAAIQQDYPAEPLFSADVEAAILHNYRIARTSDNGVFLVPRN